MAQSRERNQALGHPRLHTLRCTRLHPGCVAERTGERPRCDPGAEKTTLLICLRIFLMKTQTVVCQARLGTTWTNVSERC